jgi:hypothetical protein
VKVISVQKVETHRVVLDGPDNPWLDSCRYTRYGPNLWFEDAAPEEHKVSGDELIKLESDFQEFIK